MKRCSGCLETLDLDRFAYRDRSRGRRQTRCRACTSLRAAAHYRAYPERYKARAAAGKPRTLEANRRALGEYLRTHPCVDCGIRNTVVLEFDHCEPKRNTVSDLLRRAASWRLIAAEIAKCEVVCANCQRRRTARQFAWLKLSGVNIDRLPPLPPRGTPTYAAVKDHRNRVRRRSTNRLRLLEYLREHPCSECGIDDPVVLEFDHLRDKLAAIAVLVNDRGWAVVFEEIRKCQVLCANCHGRATAARAGRDR